MAEAILKYGVGVIQWTATAAYSCGQVIQTPDGRTAVVVNAKAVAINDEVAAAIEGVFTVTKDNSTAMAVGQEVFWDDSNNKLVANTGASGFFRFGVVTKAAASSDTTVEAELNAHRTGFQRATTSASTAVSNTTSATKFDTQVTLPANELKVGDVVRIRAQAIATSTNSTDTLALKAFIGATELIAVTAVDVSNNDIGLIEVDCVIRTVGASGTCVCMGAGSIGANASATMKAHFKASAAIDTTVANAVAVEATWSVASASNSARLDILSVQVIRPR